MDMLVENARLRAENEEVICPHCQTHNQAAFSAEESQSVQYGAQTAPPPDGRPKGQRGHVKKTKARNLAERFNLQRSKILAFVDDFAVPFDNNLVAPRGYPDIRMVKVQPKISGCFAVGLVRKPVVASALISLPCTNKVMTSLRCSLLSLLVIPCHSMLNSYE